MQRPTIKVSAILTVPLICLLLAGRSHQVAAATASPPSLVVSQLKITSSNGQFITLYNATDEPLDMSKYELEYFNNYDLSKATSSRLIALSGMVPPHGYYMVSDSIVTLCYQMRIDSQSLGLSSTAGLLEVLAFNQSAPGGSAIPVLQDYVGWSKSAAQGAQTLPQNTNALLQRQPLDSRYDPSVAASGGGTWLAVQPDSADACKLVSLSGGTVLPQAGSAQLMPATEPPATIISTADAAADAASAGPVPVMPAADIGLMSPQITELLPNPDGTGNDASDEYIELYNPNTVSFDLSGFKLQTGLSTAHEYVFPSGSTLPAHGFTAFYAGTTGLSLSNTSGRAALLDPFDNTLSASETYANAKDGQAWALAKGKWYWTTTLTPKVANVITQPVSKKKAAAQKTATKKSAVGAARTAKTAKKAALTSAGSIDAGDDTAAPIHLRTLALIAAAAILYGIYEYRTDLANHFHRLRGYLGPGAADRRQTAGRRDIPAGE
jgi:Lamin Tail Domain